MNLVFISDFETITFEGQPCELHLNIPSCSKTAPQNTSIKFTVISSQETVKVDCGWLSPNCFAESKRCRKNWNRYLSLFNATALTPMNLSNIYLRCHPRSLNRLKYLRCHLCSLMLMLWLLTSSEQFIACHFWCYFSLTKKIMPAGIIHGCELKVQSSLNFSYFLWGKISLYRSMISLSNY